MKKRHFLSLVFCLLIIRGPSLQAQQEFAPIGAKWQFEQYGCFGNPAYYGFLNIEVMKDTFLLNKNARVLSVAYINDCSENMSNQEIILASEGDKVYHYLNESYYVLYDFSAQVGDTIWHQPTAFQHTDPIYQQFDVTIDRFCSIVDSISTITIDGQILRQQHIRACDSGENFYGLGGKVIEKIGFLKGLLGTPSYEVFLLGISYPYLRCYEDNTIFYEHHYCKSVGIVDVEEQSEISIYPNPTTDFLHIETLNLGIQPLVFYNVEGKIVFSQEITSSKTKINVTHLPKGIYYIYFPSTETSRKITIF
ncbi:MAG: T9SS type A sorting domain-containing protein [Chitinophagales bacterium]